MSDSLRPHGLYSSWNSPGRNTGVGSLFLLQGIFQTQGSNPGLPLCKLILYQLSHKGSPRILEWVAYPFSRGSSWPRDWTRVSCIAGGFSEPTEKSLVSINWLKCQLSSVSSRPIVEEGLGLYWRANLTGTGLYLSLLNTHTLHHHQVMTMLFFPTWLVLLDGCP